jgi:hypothetical protein
MKKWRWMKVQQEKKKRKRRLVIQGHLQVQSSMWPWGMDPLNRLALQVSDFYNFWWEEFFENYLFLKMKILGFVIGFKVK